ncbi:alpha/beta fold hydrolase [Faecalicoccus acidiformans]|uniref:Serine aminopeptidase S33 domain-containing protein n=1 Tax=Faecalicoccus acidiformans TaxID=915173 RepID=A0ABS2FPS1_9FIRM|nr:alpha/beta hydrolase [Faecalicoccus acidiformans]MBM6831540.1 hypothetical protein [Faecalicoccus acidiformans]
MFHVFLHDFQESPAFWNPILDVMQDKTRSSIPSLYSWLDSEHAYYRDILQGLLLQCASYAEPFDLCGQGYGALLALDLAAQDPDRIRNLVLIEPSIPVSKRFQKVQQTLAHLVPSKVFDQMPISKKMYLDLMASLQDFEHRMDAISAPTWILLGENDKIHKQAAQWIQESIKTSEIRYIPDAIHDVVRQNSEAVGKFLKEIYQI